MPGYNDQQGASTGDGAVGNDHASVIAGQSSVPQRVTRILPVPVDNEGDSPSDHEPLSWASFLLRVFVIRQTWNKYDFGALFVGNLIVHGGAAGAP